MACTCKEVNCNVCNLCEEELPSAECETPNYTNQGCYPEQHTDCVIADVETDACLDTEKGEVLTSFLTKLKNYAINILNKLVPDNSISITPIQDEDDGCLDEYQIKVNISTDEGNGLELRDNGLYASSDTGTDLNPENTESIAITIADGDISANVIVDLTTNGGDNILQVTDDGLYVPPIAIPCETIETLHTTEIEGDEELIKFLTITENGCGHVLAPTGFAVTGTDRKSAFGPQEWFATLTAANTSAISGETVLIYNDTTENLTLKNGVNYKGHGVKKINNLVVNAGSPYKGSISDLDIQGTVIINSSSASNRTQVHATNVIVRGNFTAEGFSDWFGGEFKDDTTIITILDDATVNNIYAERRFIIDNSGKLRNSTIIDRSETLLANGLIYASISTDELDHAAIINCHIESDINIGIFAQSLKYPGVLVTGNTVITKSNKGIYYHCGFQNTKSSGLCTGNNVESNSGIALEVVKAGSFEDDFSVVNNYAFVVDNIARSKSNLGIHSIGASLMGCKAFSEDVSAIRVAGSDFSYINVTLEECIAKSINDVALSATRNIRVVGGTYTSLRYDADGSPILLGSLNVTVPQEHYVIAGAKLISAFPGAYKIRRTAITALPITIRDSGNHFICFNGTSSVAGIDPTIIRLPILFDSNGNFTY